MARCSCGTGEGKSCPACSNEPEEAYWCESCKQVVDDKRCPLCGLKAKKLRK